MFGAIVGFAIRAVSTVAVGQVVKAVVSNNLPIVVDAGTKTMINVGTNILSFVAGSVCGDYVADKVLKSVTVKVTVKKEDVVECPSTSSSAT